MIGQGFCHGCGFNLAEAIANKISKRWQSLQNANTSAKEGNFREAIRFLRNSTDIPDYRFAEIGRQVNERLAELRSELENWEARIKELRPIAESAFLECRFSDVIRTLRDVPTPLLDPDLKQWLEESAARREEVKRLAEEVQQARASKDYVAAVQAVDRLITLRPDDLKLPDLRTELSQKVLDRVQRYIESQRLVNAFEVLESLPPSCQDERSEKLRRDVQEVLYLREQVAKYPLATPVLYAMAEKLRKLTPRDEVTPKLVKLLKEKLQAKPDDSEMFPRWKPMEDMEFLRTGVQIPRLTSANDLKELQEFPTRFWIPYGLALNGLERAAITCTVSGEPEATGWRKNIPSIPSVAWGKKKMVELAWGIDIGPSGIKAVLLRNQAEPERPLVEKVHLLPFDIPLHRVDGGLRGEVVREKLKELKELIGDEGKKPVPKVFGLSNQQSISRFVQLPPLKDRKVMELLEKEVQMKIPVRYEDLSAFLFAFPLEKGADADLRGPWGFATTYKRRVILEFGRQLLEVGFSPKLIQTEVNALINVAMMQFDQDADQRDEAKDLKVDLWLDIGSVATNVLLVSPTNIWFRTLEMGGDTVSVRIAREMQLNFQEAELRKLNPARYENTHVIGEHTEEIILRIQRELLRSIDVARETLGSIRLRNVYVIGGSAPIHGLLPTLVGSGRAPKATATYTEDTYANPSDDESVLQ